MDDAGVVLDHTIVEAQLVGGLAQGIGQALMETAIYDEGNGQLVTGTFMDYAMPRATDMPPIADAGHNVPATTNPLGVKGVGEAGTTGSIAAIMNAIADAIPEGRGVNIDMPATPAKVWRRLPRAGVIRPRSAARPRARRLAFLRDLDRRDLDAVSPARLGEIERLVGERDELGQILARVDDHRNPDAGGGVNGLVVDDRGVGREAAAQPVRHQIGVVHAGVRQHHGELFTAKAPDQIGLAQARPAWSWRRSAAPCRRLRGRSGR